MQILVRSVSGRLSIWLDVQPTDTVEDVKRMLNTAEDLPLRYIQLYATTENNLVPLIENKLRDPAETLGVLGIRENSTLLFELYVEFQLVVSCSEGRGVKRLVVQTNYTVFNAKLQYAAQLGTNRIDQLVLYDGEQVLDDRQKLSYYNLNEGGELRCEIIGNDLLAIRN